MFILPKAINKQCQENYTPDYKERHWSPCTLHIKLTKNAQYSTLNPFSPESPEDAPHPPRSQLHRKILHNFSFFPLMASPHQWVLRKVSSSQCRHCPMVQKPKPWQETKLLSACHRAKSVGQMHLCPQGQTGGFTAQCGTSGKCREHHTHKPRGLIPNAVLLCILSLEIQTEMEPSISLYLLKTWLRNN